MYVKIVLVQVHLLKPYEVSVGYCKSAKPGNLTHCESNLEKEDHLQSSSEHKTWLDTNDHLQ